MRDMLKNFSKEIFIKMKKFKDELNDSMKETLPPEGSITKEHLSDELYNSIPSVGEEFTTKYTQEFKDITITTNHDNPIYLRSNTHYIGHGTVIKTSSTAKHHVADVMTNPHPDSVGVRPWTENIIIEGFTFDGSSETTPGDLMTHVIMLAVYQCRNVTIRNCTFRNSFGSYIILHTCENITIENCYFYGGDSCVNGDNGSYKNNIVVRNCFFDGLMNEEYTISEPITMKKASYVTVDGNFVENKKGTCCAMNVGCDTVKVINNTFKSFGSVLCGTRDSVNVEISDNILYGDNFQYNNYGIGVCNSHGSISRNKIYNVRTAGIFVTSDELLGTSAKEQSNDIVIEDNILVNNMDSEVWVEPILIEGYGKILIQDNKLLDWVSKHISVVTVKSFGAAEEGKTVTYDIDIIENYFNDKTNIVRFLGDIQNRDDITVNFNVARNTGGVKYDNLLSYGYSYSAYVTETVEPSN